MPECTHVIHASSSSGFCNPSALMAGGLPMAVRVFIQEVGTQAADIQVCVELTEIVQGHPVHTRHEFAVSPVLFSLICQNILNSSFFSYIVTFFCILLKYTDQNSPSSRWERQRSRSSGLTVFHKDDL